MFRRRFYAERSWDPKVPIGGAEPGHHRRAIRAQPRSRHRVAIHSHL